MKTLELLRGVEEVILPGMYEYADGLICSELIEGKQVRGIVGSVDEAEILIWCLQRKRCLWSPEYWNAGTSDEQLRGWETTAMILAKAKVLSRRAPTAEYCAEYDFDGVEKGTAFIPSCADFKKLKPQVNAVKAAYERLGLGEFEEFGEILWSSSEYSTSGVWGSFRGSGGLDWEYKTCINSSVRPVRLVTR